MSTTRRTLLSFAAVPAAAAIATAPLVLASAPLTGPDPDAALFAAEAAYRQAEAACLAATEARRVAGDAYDAALGPCPSELTMWDYEYGALTHPGAPRGVRGVRAFRWRADTDNRPSDRWYVWTSSGLRAAIRYAVPLFGRGGQTPFHIRRWRTLLPIAEAFDARADALASRYQIEELIEAARAADKARIAAETRFGRIPAMTVAGLAAKVRHMDGFGWRGMGGPWVALLQSAAAVSGVALTPMRFDCERWAAEMRAIGGRVWWNEDAGEGSISWPVDHRHTPEQKAEIKRLNEEHRINRDDIRFWLSQGGAS